MIYEAHVASRLWPLTAAFGAAIPIALLVPACFLVDPGPERPAGFGEEAGDLDSSTRGLDSDAEVAPDTRSADTPPGDPADESTVDTTPAEDALSDTLDDPPDMSTPSDAADVSPDDSARDASTDTAPPDAEHLDIAGDSTEEDTATADSGMDTGLSDIGDPGLTLCGDEPAELGEPCSCGELGAALWVCDDDDELVCTDGNDTADKAEVVVFPGMSVNMLLDSWIDSPDDIDWWQADVNDRDASTSEPEVYPEGELDDSVEMELCVFYRYGGTRDITPYQCAFGTCAVYEADTGEVLNGSCTSSPVFDLFNDLYGCCGLNGIVRMDGVDGDESDDSGIMYVRVGTPTNELTEGCMEYSLVVGH